jgi:hypothetical protein
MYRTALGHLLVRVPALEPSLPFLYPLLGKEFTDTVTISPGVVIPSQSVGVASTVSGIQDVDGILG